MTKFGERIESPPQEVAGIGWYIRARPKAVDNVTYLTCRLAGKNPFTWSAAVDAVFRIVKKNGGGFGKKSSFRNVLMGKEPLEDSLGWTKFVTSEVFRVIYSQTKDFVGVAKRSQRLRRRRLR